MKKYKINHSEEFCIREQKRRTLKKSLESTFTPKQWEQTKEHFNNSCCYCGKELPLEMEHLIALSKGGEYTSNNIIPSCKSCNCSKNNKDFFIWYPKYRHYSKKREKKILEFLNYKNEFQQLKII